MSDGPVPTESRGIRENGVSFGLPGQIGIVPGANERNANQKFTSEMAICDQQSGNDAFTPIVASFLDPKGFDVGVTAAASVGKIATGPARKELGDGGGF